MRPRLALVWFSSRAARRHREIWRLALVGDDGLSLGRRLADTPDADADRVHCDRDCDRRRTVPAGAHAWLDAFRLTTAGALLLGRIFSLLNIVAYVVGILVGTWLDRLVEMRR